MHMPRCCKGAAIDSFPKAAARLHGEWAYIVLSKIRLVCAEKAAVNLLGSPYTAKRTTQN